MGSTPQSAARMPFFHTPSTQAKWLPRCWFVSSSRSMYLSTLSIYAQHRRAIARYTPLVQAPRKSTCVWDVLVAGWLVVCQSLLRLKSLFFMGGLCASVFAASRRVCWFVDVDWAGCVLSVGPSCPAHPTGRGDSVLNNTLYGHLGGDWLGSGRGLQACN